MGPGTEAIRLTAGLTNAIALCLALAPFAAAAEGIPNDDASANWQSAPPFTSPFDAATPSASPPEADSEAAVAEEQGWNAADSEIWAEDEVPRDEPANRANRADRAEPAFDAPAIAANERLGDPWDSALSALTAGSAEAEAAPLSEEERLRNEIRAAEAELWEAVQTGTVVIDEIPKGSVGVELGTHGFENLRELSDAEFFAETNTSFAGAPPLAPLGLFPLADEIQREARRAELAAGSGDFSWAFARAGWLQHEAELARDLGDRERARELLEQAVELAPGNATAWLELAALETEIGVSATRENAVAAVVRMLSRGPVQGFSGAEERALPTFSTANPDTPDVSAAEPAAISNLPTALAASASSLWRGPADERWQFASLVIAALSLLFAAGNRIRRRGDLSIFIEYPPELGGAFSVELHRTRRSADRAEQRPTAAILAGRSSTRRQHNLVKRETRFGSLPTGRYHLVIDGVMLDPASREEMARCWLRKEIEIVHERTVREHFDVTPQGCPVDVTVRWNGAPAEARVTVLGMQEPASFTTLSQVRLLAPKGEQIIAAGAADRVAEKRVRVRSFLPTEVTLDLAGPPEPVFKGCPPAVEPYLRGDYEAAALALGRDGQTDAAHRLRAILARKSGDLSKAADHFEAAGQWVEAAAIHAERREFARAGELYEAAADWLSAADMFQRAREPVRAGGAFEAARDFDSAIDCYRDAGDTSRWLDVLERRGELFEAGRIALHGTLRARGIRLLQRVAPVDPHYAEACELLADAFEQEKHWDLAARKLGEAIEARRPAEAPSEAYSRLADLHEKAGNLEDALGVLEDLRMRDPGYPTVAARVEELRKTRSAKRVAELAATSLADREIDQSQTVLLPDKRYELGEEIGRGGMGVVYRAHDTRLGRVVALKKLSDTQHNTHGTVQLFLREAQAAASLNHPNIVTVYDADQEDGRLFFTMELLEGWALPAILHGRGPLEAIELARIGVQVCRGLAYAHEQKIVHRDIKSANLFLTTDYVVKIMDFGLAKTIEKMRSGATLIGGTPYYMAPEQIDGSTAIDHRADLYALGVTFYELMTGSVPFPDGDAAYHHRHSPAPDPRVLRPEVPDALAELILSMLSKRPEERPDSARVIGSALEELIAAESLES